MGEADRKDGGEGGEVAFQQFHLVPDGKAQIRVDKSDVLGIGVVVDVRIDGGSFSDKCRLHWGLVGGKGSHWEPPPNGWVTKPDVSYDAGDNAWQTPFENGLVRVHFGDNVKPFKAFSCVVWDTAHDKWYKSDNYGNMKVELEGLQVLWDTPNVENGAVAKKIEENGSVPVPNENNKLKANGSHKTPQEKRALDAERIWTSLAVDAGSTEPIIREGEQKVVADQNAISWIANCEHKAERSLMHRYDLVREFVQHFGASTSALTTLAVWMQLSTMRFLVWNRNYNVKPREISRSHDKASSALAELLGPDEASSSWEPLRMALSKVGRGGSSDMGQSIREEILIIQRNNHCKGGLMEEWHQKLHNNTSPDDVVICEALIAFIEAKDDKLQVYWKHLNDNGIDRDRLKSFDRAIWSEPDPDLSKQPNLKGDLQKFLVILRAVHDGLDLKTASEKVVGYRQDSRKSHVTYAAVPGIDIGLFNNLLKVFWYHPDVLVKLEAILELRRIVSVAIKGVPSERRLDLIFLDFALEQTLKTQVEGQLKSLRDAEMHDKAMCVLAKTLENAARSSGHNRDLLYALSMLKSCLTAESKEKSEYNLKTLAAADRIKVSLLDHTQRIVDRFQDTAVKLCDRMGMKKNVAEQVTEEITRSSCLASVSLVLGCVMPVLRQAAGRGCWEILSSFGAEGKIQLEESLVPLQGHVFAEPVVIVVDKLSGFEDIPQGCAGVVIRAGGDQPDLLSHIAVRARNEHVLLAACHDEKVSNELRDSKYANLSPHAGSEDVKVKLSG
ncbi:hypothetical protein NDN08_005452 [Rhodosorus marinus]|uniref:CBM20 domain-containing protein n=1 Tax=Rhodosorus marinus TaxID=101924 RepID=A0AAV8V490_9RHOD|nr:hypothetical protein NDN08_005452 [Rhodosorus marinus]